MNNGHFPLVSIIIPNYNYMEYLAYCLTSCLSQNYPNLEIIVVDDASTDKSREVIMKFANYFYGIVPLFGEENKGYSAAKNAGIEASKGEYIVHLDADDMILPTSITDRVRSFELDPELEFVHAQAFKFNGDKSYRWCLENIKKLEVDDKAQVHAQTWMLKRSVYERFGLYVPAMRSKSDKEMLARLRLLKKQFGKFPPQTDPLVKAKKIDVPVAFYRKHEKSMIKGRSKNKDYNDKIETMFAERMKIYDKEGITRKNTPFISN